MTNTFLYLAVSGFTIWFIQSQKIFDKLFFNDFLKEMRKCKICLGFWVCGLYALVFRIGLLDIFATNYFAAIVNWFVTAIVSSFVIFLIIEGWKSRYGVTVV